MDFNFNGQYPYTWGNSFIPNGFNSGISQQQTQAATSSIPAVGTPTAPTPTPLFTVTQTVPSNAPPSGTSLPPGLHGFNTGMVNTGLFPFGMNSPYPNTHHQNAQFTPPNWNYGYNMSRFPQSAPPIVTDNGNTSINNVNAVRHIDSVIQDSKANIREGAQSNFNVSLLQDNDKSREMSKEAINQDLLAMKVSSLLSDSGVLKEAISRSLQNSFSQGTNSASDDGGSKILNECHADINVAPKKLPQLPLSTISEQLTDQSSVHEHQLETSKSDDETDIEQSPSSIERPSSVRYNLNIN